MKKTALLIVAVALALAVCLPASAQFADVPTDHWAYQAIQTLSQAGIIQGYPDGTFGGKRALTRYEFAEALAKAIPTIQKMCAGGAGVAGVPGPAGPAGATGPAGPAGPSGINTPEFKALQSMVREFGDELRAQGVDIERLNRDVAALGVRVAALEAEVARVRFTGEGNFIARADITNVGTVIDRDGRSLASNSPITNNPLNNTFGYTEFEFGMKAKVNNTTSLNAMIAAGDYLTFAFNPGPGNVTNGGLDQFLLWNLNADAALDLGFLGKTQAVIGRFPFQLTPLTMKLVDPDSYTFLSKTDDGNFIYDGAKATMNFGGVALTAFAGKNNLGNLTTGTAGANSALPLLIPALQTPDVGGAPLQFSQTAGARAVLGTPFGGTLGLTYYKAGLGAGRQDNVLGADISANVASIGVTGEWAKSDPNSTLVAGVTGIDGTPLNTLNTAWNGKLNFQTGKLGLAAGYTQVEANYNAPGYWARLGSVVNPTNVKGVVADLNYAFTPGLVFSAAGQFLQPINTGVAVGFRTATDRTQSTIASVDKANYWRAGLKYALTSVNSVDLGYEELQVSTTGTSGTTDKERFISLGVGHSFSSNATLKLLYQIIEFQPTGAAADRGGVAAAQFQVKY